MAFNLYQQPAGKAYARSPVLYLIHDTQYTEANSEYTAEVFIWDGDFTSIAGAADYTLKRLPDSTGYAIFDLHNLLLSWFEDLPLTRADFRSDDMVFNLAVKFYFKSDVTTSVLRSTSSTIQFVFGYAEYLDGFNWANPDQSGQNAMNEYAQRVIDDGGTVEAIDCINSSWLTSQIDGFMTDRPKTNYIPHEKRFTIGLEYETASDVKSLYFYGSDGTNKYVDFTTLNPVDFANETLLQVECGTDTKWTDDLDWYYVQGRGLYGVGEITDKYYFYLKDACKWGYLNLAFINRFGVWDYVQFWARKDESYKVDKEMFIRSGGFVSSNALTYLEGGQMQNTNIKAQTSMMLNTGYVDEEMSAVVQQMLLSPTIRDADTNEPYIIESKSETYKQQPNERLINYTISVKKAFSHINSVT